MSGCGENGISAPPLLEDVKSILGIWNWGVWEAIFFCGQLRLEVA